MFDEALDGFSVALVQTAEVGQRKYAPQPREAFFFQVLPNGVAGEEEYGFGMIDDVMYIIRVEILQDGDHDATISDGSHIGDAPAGIVLADNGYFVAAAQLAMFKKQMQSGYLLRYLTVSITFVFSIIRVAGKIPVFAEARFV